MKSIIKTSLSTVLNHKFSSNNKQPPQTNQYIQNEYVYKTYDKIAEHFSQTRYKPWPQVANFLLSLERNSLVLDVGCGNGRYMGVNHGIQMVGIDRCLPFLDIVANRQGGNNVLAADATKLPFRTESFDAFICIALLHHFTTEQMRQNTINECGRILKRNGKGLIYVSAFQVINLKNQLVRTRTKRDRLAPWHLQLKYEKDLQKSIESGHRYVPQKNSIIYQRFYHFFEKEELEELVNGCRSLRIQSLYYDKSNWACIVQKN